MYNTKCRKTVVYNYINTASEVNVDGVMVILLCTGMNKGQVVKLCRRIKSRLSNVRVLENNKTLGGEIQMDKSSSRNPLGTTRGQTTLGQMNLSLATLSGQPEDRPH